MNPKVDAYITRNKPWAEEIEQIRDVLLNTGLTEELKWGSPCYTLDGNNIVLIHCFKEYCAILFFKGVLLKDPKKILVQQTKNVQSARHLRFTDVKEVVKLRSAIKSYVKEAIEIEKSGQKVEFKKTSEFEMPEEFKKVLKKNATLKKAFGALTPGRQRGYLLFFAAPKQTATRESRIAKYTQHILDGKGLND